MLRWLFRRKLDAEEKRLGESMDYLRHIVDVSPAAMLRFSSILPFVNSRKTLPKDAWYVAQIVAVRQEDCGTCLQIAVNLARQEGVDLNVLRNTVAGNREALPPELAGVYRFTESIVTAAYDEDELRETLRGRYGDRGLIELSYAIASSRIHPTLKRALGYARTCKQVTVEVP